MNIFTGDFFRFMAEYVIKTLHILGILIKYVLKTIHILKYVHKLYCF
jgi:hypothetical protein